MNLSQREKAIFTRHTSNKEEQNAKEIFSMPDAAAQCPFLAPFRV